MAKDCLAEQALAMLRTLGSRRRHFGEAVGAMFGDPVYSMLLELYVAGCRGHPIYLSQLCVASGVPATSALRLIDRLIGLGMVRKEGDATDGRRRLMRLTLSASEAVERHLGAFG